MEEYPKLFTLEEARKILPEIKLKLEKAKKLNKSLNLLKSIQIEQEDSTDIGNLALLEFATKQYKLLHLIFAELFEISKKGAIVKDLDEGLIDFHSQYEGKEILLCWKYGENTINYWHDLESGYAGRKHVSLLNNNEIEDQ